MAEVKTAPVSKPVSKAAAKTSKPKPTVQAKPEMTRSLDRLVQPFLNTSRPGNTSLSDQKNTTALSGLWKNSVQTKLKVGQPGDKYEQEADAVADKVVSSPKPDISKQPEEDKLDPKPAVQLSIEPEEEVQASLEEEPEIQKQADEEPEIQAAPAEEDEVQASTEPEAIQAMGTDSTVSPDFESKLSTAKSGGSPLSQSTISRVEPHVNADLSGVRVHTDSNAAELNRSLGAQAFANQNHIFFNEGKYNPGTTAGDHLIAHEATHTVQQGASVKKKAAEEEAPDELQMAPDESVNETKQTAAAPLPAAPPADAIPNANTDAGNSNARPGTSGTQVNAQASSNDSSTAQTNNTVANPPAGSSGGDALAPRPQEDLQKENPITQRAASYKEEEVTEVKALGMEGNSEQAMASFTGAGASQVAMAFPTMGDTLNQKLGAEKQTAAIEAPKLTAGTTGVKDQKSQKAAEPGGGKSADLKDGITEAEPGQQQLEPHQEGAPLPTYKEDKRLDEGKPAKEESGGFFSWLFDKFKNLMGGINTQDKGLNTQAGAAPKLDTKGKANPQRAENQSKEGKDQVNKEKQEAAKEINNNPGQQNVQPLFFEEPKEVVIDATLQSTATTGQDQSMTDFVHLPLPESVRTQADLDLAPRMEKTLAKPRQETKAAAQKRDTEKQAAINDKQAEVEKMNKDAENEQQNLVNENRQAIAAEQKRGVDEAETQMNAFSTEADKEKARANKDVNDRIKNDQAEGEKKLKAAEGEAATKKKEGEDQAKAEKEAAKKNSKDKSWWGKFKDAVSSAVSWVTEKIGKIFDAIRKAVKFIIDKAKKAALALIEAGRKWIIDKLDKFGSWLKEKANKYLKHFPALRKRVNAFIDKTVDGAKKLVNKVADGLKKGVEALADALGKAINSVLSAFEGVLTAAVQFAGAMLKGDFAEALKIAFMATCKVAGIDPNPILNFINKAGETIGLIFKNPAAFFGNVAGGVKLGINQFTKNIKKHLISGLISWLTGAMSDVPIQLPAKFDLKGVFSLVMQILGLTYQRIRAKVVKRIGPKGEQVVSGMEKTFQFVKDLVTKGPIVIWERIKDKFNEIKEMAMEKIRNLVTIEVVKAGIKWIIGLLNPASAIVKAVIMLYDFVMFLIERKDQIIGFVTAVFDTVGPLARGQIKKAGNAVEGAMGRGVPVILGLLANLAGLGGIGKSVSKVIKTIQKPVDKVVDPVIGWLVKQGKKLYGKGKAGVKKAKEAIKNLGKKIKISFKQGKESHSLYFKTSGNKKTLMRASTPEPLKSYTDRLAARINALPTTDKRKPELQRIIGNALAARRELEAAKNRDTKSSRNPNETIRQPKYASWDDKLGDKMNQLMLEMTQHLAKIPADLAEGTDNEGNSLAEEGMLARPKSTPIDYRKQHQTPAFKDAANPDKGLAATSTDGEMAIVDTLSMDLGSNVGSGATYSSPLYSALNRLRGMSVVPGHLINHHVGGSGTKKENLAPISKSANGAMAQGQEEDLNRKILTENKVVKYKVFVIWSPSPRTDGHYLLDNKMPSKILSSLQEKSFDEKKHANLLKDRPSEYIKAKQNPGNWLPKGSAKSYSVPIAPFTTPAGSTLTDVQLRLLQTLRGGPLTDSQVSIALPAGASVSPGTLAQLEKDGFIETIQAPDPGGSTTIVYKVTDGSIDVNSLGLRSANHKTLLSTLQGSLNTGMSVAELSEKTGIKVGTVRAALKSLVANDKVPLQETTRVKDISHRKLTPEGRAKI